MDSLVLFEALTPTATLPSKAYEGDAGYDLYASLEAPVVLQPLDRALIPTGVRVHLPVGYYGRIAPRSGLALRFGLDVLAGVVDYGFSNEIGVILINFGREAYTVRPDDKIAQLVITPIYSPNTSEVSVERGLNGFGSSGP